MKQYWIFKNRSTSKLSRARPRFRHRETADSERRERTAGWKNLRDFGSFFRSRGNPSSSDHNQHSM
jgi:hypothetical protein